MRLKAQLQRFENQQLDAGLARIASAQASHFVGLLGAFVPGEVIADDCAALDMLLLLHRVASKEAVLRDHLATCACSCCVVAWRATPASSLTCLLAWWAVDDGGSVATGEAVVAAQQYRAAGLHGVVASRAALVLVQLGVAARMTYACLVDAALPVDVRLAFVSLLCCHRPHVCGCAAVHGGGEPHGNILTRRGGVGHHARCCSVRG